MALFFTIRNLSNMNRVATCQPNGRVVRASGVVVAALASALAMPVVMAADGAPAAPSWQAGPVTLTFGGFTALESLYRNRDEATVVGSDFNTKIPFAYQSTQHGVSEFRESARQSRLAIDAQGPSSGPVTAEGYFEMDFLGDAQNANSNESNSYTPRIRHIYGLYKNSDTGLYMLAGQTWSLATMNSQGLSPRKEQVPLTIDAQYVPGFNWTRNPQLRFVEAFSKEVSVGISFESPQGQFATGPTAVTGAVVNTPGNQQLVSATPTLDFIPDTVVKAAFDPGYGHYEVYGLLRGFRDRNTTLSQNNTTYGGGVGGGLILPLVPKVLDFQASVLAGKGIGRYGSAQLPDVTVKPDATLATISEVDALVGLQYKPTPLLTLYLYGGMEKASAAAFSVGSVGYGYGSPLYNNSGCDLTTGTASNCVANTKQITQGTIGTWWKYYEGELGNLQVGLQGSYTKRQTFAGVGGDPTTSLTAVMVSIRYYPYQR